MYVVYKPVIEDINYNILTMVQTDFPSKGQRSGPNEEPRWHTRSAALSCLWTAVERTLHVLPTKLFILIEYLQSIGKAQPCTARTISYNETSVSVHSSQNFS
jgi:hypothetical protein